MNENLLLSLIENDARMSVTDLAAALNESEESVLDTLNTLQKDKVIGGYHTIINWDKTNTAQVTAMIIVGATPEREYGYEKIAEEIYRFPEVDTMYLMSGKGEFTVIINGKTMQDIANFVATKLACIEGVTSTSTLFVLKKYKSKGIIFDDAEDASKERLIVTP